VEECGVALLLLLLLLFLAVAAAAADAVIVVGGVCDAAGGQHIAIGSASHCAIVAAERVALSASH
jgi:hypothetical protein